MYMKKLYSIKFNWNFLFLGLFLTCFNIGWGQTNQFFDASTTNAFTASKWASTCTSGSSAFTAGNIANFCTVNGTGSGSVGITVGGVIALESYIHSAATGTFGTGGTFVSINVANSKIFNLGGASISTAAGTGFNKTGTGSLQWSGGAFSGGFTLTDGTIILAGSNAMGSGGALTINGGIITPSSSATRDLSNKYTSGITIGGNFQLGDAVNFSAGTGDLTFNNNVSLGNSVTRTITLGNTGTYTFSGIISGTSSNLIVNNTAAGTLTLGGTNSYSGNTTINGGTVSVSADQNLGAVPGSPTPGKITLGGGSLAITTGYTMSSNRGISLTTATSSTINVASSQTLNYGGIIAGSGTLIKEGSGILSLSGINSFSGGLNFNTGTINLESSTTTLGSGTITMANGTTLSTTSFVGEATLSNNIALTSGAVNFPTPFGSAGQIILSGIISGAGAINQTSDISGRRITLNGINTFSGGYTMSGTSSGNPTVTFNNGSAFGTGTITSTITGVDYNTGFIEPSVQLTSVDGVYNNIVVSNASDRIVFFVDGSKHLAHHGVISGSGYIVKTGSATLSLRGANTFTGTTLVNAGTLRLFESGGTTLPSTNNVTINGGNMEIVTNQTLNNLTLTSGTLTVNDGVILTINGTFTGGGIIVNNGKIVIKGNSTFPGATSTISSFKDLEIDRAGGVSLDKNLNITGTLTITSGTLTTGGFLTLKSSASGTARIAAGTGSYITGNITVERYIPAKASRRFSFITSPVSQALSAAWQQQIHITGAGTGGTPCPTLTAHSNGFDASTTNAPNLFSYNASNASGSRWVANITGTTGFTLTPGTGYRLNVRGARSIGCNLLNGNAGGLIPTAVTLSATGVISNAQKNIGSFNITYNNNLANNWVLMGNPYPSEIDFTAFRTTNSGVINASYIIYDPQNAPNNVTPANMYSTWNAGTWSNAATSISNANGQYIANGQAFFVQATAASNITLNFTEAHKYNGAQNGVFRTAQTWNDILRIAFKKDAVDIDQTVIRYSNEASINNNRLGNLDASLLSSSESYLGTIKAGNLTSIQTRSLQQVQSDSVALDFNVSETGNYGFNFSEHDNFTAANIYLLDKYTNTTTEVKANPVYSFGVDKANAATQTNRFVLVFNKAIAPVVATITGIKMYPNPANKNLTIELPLTEGKYTLRITDVIGKQVYQNQLAGGVQAINISKLAQGNYVVETTDTKGNRAVEKLVKQ